MKKIFLSILSITFLFYPSFSFAELENDFKVEFLAPDYHSFVNNETYIFDTEPTSIKYSCINCELHKTGDENLGVRFRKYKGIPTNSIQIFGSTTIAQPTYFVGAVNGTIESFDATVATSTNGLANYSEPYFFAMIPNEYYTEYQNYLINGTITENINPDRILILQINPASETHAINLPSDTITKIFASASSVVGDTSKWWLALFSAPVAFFVIRRMIGLF